MISEPEMLAWGIVPWDQGELSLHDLPAAIRWLAQCRATVARVDAELAAIVARGLSA